MMTPCAGFSRRRRARRPRPRLYSPALCWPACSANGVPGPRRTSSRSLLTLFRGAVILASFIMVLSVTANYLADRNDAAGPLPLANTPSTLQLPP